MPKVVKRVRKVNENDILRKAIEVFGKDGENWIQNNWYLDPTDEVEFDGPTKENAKKAAALPRVEVCALGALEVATVKLGQPVYGKMYMRAAHKLDMMVALRRCDPHLIEKGETAPGAVFNFNDTCSFTEVKELFCEAVATPYEELERKVKELKRKEEEELA